MTRYWIVLVANSVSVISVSITAVTTSSSMISAEICSYRRPFISIDQSCLSVSADLYDEFPHLALRQLLTRPLLRS